MADDNETITVDGVEIPKKVFSSIRESERKNIWKDLERELDSKFQGLASEIRGEKENASVKDVLKGLSDKFSNLEGEIDKLKNPNRPPKDGIELEKELARQREENEKQLNAEREALFRQSVESQIQAKLISKGWKDSYQTLIPSLIAQHWQIENDNGQPLFRDKSDGNAIISGSAADRADEIVKKYPDMVAQPKPGFGTTQNGSAPASAGINPEKATARDMIAAGFQSLVKP